MIFQGAGTTLEFALLHVARCGYAPLGYKDRKHSISAWIGENPRERNMENPPFVQNNGFTYRTLIAGLWACLVSLRPWRYPMTTTR